MLQTHGRESDCRMNTTLSESVHGGILIGALGVFAWLVGGPLVFPSLGPTAYVIAKAPDDPPHQPRAVISGHVIAIIAGLVGYHLFASGLSLGVPHPSQSTAVLRLVVSGIFAMIVTSVVMLWTDIDHAPACATTLLFALGLLSTLWDSLLIFTAIIILVLIEEGVKRAPFTLPRRQDE